MENCENIWYLDCPHFTVGNADQWGEHGFLLFERNVYTYEVDRKEQTSNTHSPTTIADFLKFAAERHLEIPEEFRVVLAKL